MSDSGPLGATGTLSVPKRKRVSAPDNDAQGTRGNLAKPSREPNLDVPKEGGDSEIAHVVERGSPAHTGVESRFGSPTTACKIPD